MKKVIVICGPTAVGKTKVSIDLAKALNGEIINADSMQIYQKMDIGTAKITESEKEGIPHHLFDMKNLDEDYSVQEYQLQARQLIDEVTERGKVPIIVGGTGLYINAVLYNYEFQENSHDTYDGFSNEALYQLIQERNIDYQEHLNNRRRMINALNNVRKNDSNQLLYDVKIITLTMPRNLLYERINNRVDEMKKQGLEQEVGQLIKTYPNSRALKTAIGYKEFFDKDDDIWDQIKQHSRNYAKKQLTWFKNKLSAEWFDVTDENYYPKIIEYIKK